MSSTPYSRDRLVSSLLRADAYPHPAGVVEHIETHISDLFLAGNFVYKIKKPVNFGFCDFSTLALRKRFTERELKLNQRLSEGTHLSVEEVRHDQDTGMARIGGTGEVIEYALKMRRLESDNRLDRLLADPQGDRTVITQLSDRLAEFHDSSPRASPEFGAPDAIADIVLSNIDRVEEHGGEFLAMPAIADLRGFSLAFLSSNRAALQRRHDEDFIRQCHGDLHAENVFIEPCPDSRPLFQIIDCIEFNDRLIYIDVAADMAFLSMDLKHRGHSRLARTLISEYAARSGDHEMRPLLPFYEQYRAMVRCLSAAISASQATNEESRKSHRETARTYLLLAGSIASELRPQLLFIMSGITGTGKSTIAAALAKQWGLRHLQTDVIRRELAGLGPNERTDSGVRAGIYSPEMSLHTYREMNRRARRYLASGESVIMDGTHLRRDFRQSSLRVGRSAGVTTGIIECSLKEEEAIRRLESRYAAATSESEGRPEVHRAQRPSWQPVSDDEADIVVRLDTQEEATRQYGKLWGQLWTGVLGQDAKR